MNKPSVKNLRLWLTSGVAALAIGLTGCASVASALGTASSTATSTGTVAASTTTTLALAADHDDSADYSYDAGSVVAIDVSNPTATDGVTVADGVITITKAGAYRLSGTLSDGQVVVNTEDGGTVHLILDNVSITNADGSALAVLQSKLTIVHLAAGSTNTLVDGKTYADTSDDAPSAALFSADDLTITGTGTLNVTGNHNDGIAGKDGVVISSGTVTVTAVDDGIRGKDYLVIKGGKVSVTSGGDSLKSDNDSDQSLGYVSITGGTVSLSSGDDGVDAWTAIGLSGGTTTVTKSVEGLEARVITVSGGTTTVTASDDGVNATDSAWTGGDMAAQTNTLLSITGGKLTVNADGDGLDSNGSIAMSGGTVVVSGPMMNGNGALDYNGTFVVTGGSLMAGGSAGMAQVPSDTSSLKSLKATVDAAAGATIEVKDSSGTVVATFKATKQTATLVVTNDKIKAGETYTVYVNGTATGTTDTTQATSAGMGGPRR